MYVSLLKHKCLKVKHVSVSCFYSVELFYFVALNFNAIVVCTFFSIAINGIYNNNMCVRFVGLQLPAPCVAMISSRAYH